MHKKIKSTLIIFLSILMMTTSIQALDKNLHLNLYAITEEVSSGDKANFVLELKTTGSKAKLRDVEITVALPEQYPLANNPEELTLFGIEPEINGKQLKYYFSELKTGMNERKIIQFQTKNGYELNKAQIKLSAQVNVENQLYTEAQADTLINAAGSIEVAKVLEEVEGKSKYDAPNKNDVLIWNLKISSNKRNNGQMFLDENKKIEVVDTLPQELIYISDSHNGQYDPQTHSVRWYLDVPSYGEQEKNSEQLFVENITLKTKTIDLKDEIYVIPITNKLAAQGHLLDGSVVKNSTSASVVMSDGKGSVPDVSGTYYYGGHRGPLNGEGQIGPNANKNPVPSVYDTAELGFIYQYFIQPGPGSIIEKDGKPFLTSTYTNKHRNHILTQHYEFIEASYKPSKGLLLNEIVLTKPRLFYKSGLAAVDMPALPKARLIITTDEGEIHELEVDYNDFEASRENISIKKNFGKKLRVKELIFRIEPNTGQKFVDGRIGVTNMLGLYFNIENNFTGQIDNSVRTNYKLKNDPAIYTIKPSNKEAQYGNRQATVLPKPKGTLPIAETKISLETQYAGVILPGANTINVEFNNTKGSLDRITNDYELFLKIPNNVILDLDKIKYEKDFVIKSAETVKNDEDYHYYKIVVEGDSEGLLPGEGVHLQIPAEVLDTGSSALELSVYSHSSTKDLLTPNYNGDAITNTVVTAKDDQAILEGIISDELNFLKSENAYTLIKQEGIYTNKSVKGSLDKIYSDFAHTELGQNVDYQLEVKHNLDSAVKDMVLVDVLPSVNDLGITDNVARDSKFNLVLTQEIQLNEQMQDKFEVYYSTAKNPQRDVLNQVASNKIENPADAQEPHWTLGKDVADFTKINSFMIKLKKGSVFQSQASLEINFTMQAPETLAHEYISISKDDKYNEEKAAWNSFAVAINGLQVVEPSRVGVIIVDEDLEIKEPKINKLIKKETDYLKEDTVKKDEDIIFDILVTMPDSVNAYQSLTITDHLNERFTLKEVRFNEKVLPLASVYQNGTISYTLDRDQLHALEKEGVKELNLSLTASLNDLGMDKFGNVQPVENTAQLDVNHKFDYEVEKPTIVTPHVNYGEVTVAVTEGPNAIVERNTVEEYGEKRLIDSNATLTSHPDNPYDISIDFTTKNDDEIIRVPEGLYIIQQDKVLDHYQITQESLLVAVKNGRLTVVEIINPKIPTPAAFIGEKKVSIEDDKETAQPGDALRYTIEITNTGETKGTVNVVDSLEHLIDYIDLDIDSPLQITNYELDKTYSLKDLMQGFSFELEGLQTIGFHFNLKLKDQFETDVSTLVNEAFVNDVPIEVEVKVKTPKIAIEKLVSDENQDGYAEAGEILTYTINVSNTGEAKAKQVLIKDDLSQVQDYMLPITHATITSNQGTEFVDIADLQAGILRDIEADEVLSISFDMQVKGDIELEEGFEFINRASANDEEAEVKITYIKAIITAEKIVVDENENGLVEAGETLTYTIIIKNSGQKDAENVFVKDDLKKIIDHIETPDDNPLYLNGLRFEDKTLKDLIDGLNIERISAQETVTISFEVKMNAELDQDLLALINIAQVNNEYPTVEIPIKPFEPTPLEPLDPKPEEPEMPTPTEPEEPIFPEPTEPIEPTVPKPVQPEEPTVSKPAEPEKPKEDDGNNPQFESLPATGLSDTVSNMANGFILTGALTIVISLLKKRDEA